MVVDQETEADEEDPEYEQDFNKAYSKLVEKIYVEQGPNILLSQQEIVQT